jgi:hypothetical protein
MEDLITSMYFGGLCPRTFRDVSECLSNYNVVRRQTRPATPPHVICIPLLASVDMLEQRIFCRAPEKHVANRLSLWWTSTHYDASRVTPDAVSETVLRFSPVDGTANSPNFASCLSTGNEDTSWVGFMRFLLVIAVAQLTA